MNYKLRILQISFYKIYYLSASHIVTPTLQTKNLELTLQVLSDSLESNLILL